VNEKYIFATNLIKISKGMGKSNKKKIRMEFEIKASPAMLFNYISSPSGLSQWFCNDVDRRVLGQFYSPGQ
jgi:uncharacterized protein YndB with AHSA1/START domain